MELKPLILQALEHFGVPAGESEVERLLAFLGELERWNRKMNLVGPKDPGRVCRELMADALFLNSRIAGVTRLVDVGSGSGILSIPLAVLNPSITVCSVDSSMKKIQFQRHVRRTVGIANFEPVAGRIEDCEPLHADGLTAKAFSDTRSILEAGRRHLVPGGRVFVLKGRDERPGEDPCYGLLEDTPYTLPGVDKGYRLFVYKKIS